MGISCKEGRNIIDAFIEPIISDAVEKAKSRDGQLADARTDEDERSADTLLSHLVRMTAGTWAQWLCPLMLTVRADRKLIKDEILNIAIAGRDTVRRS